jgi:hypothetical protein
LGRRRVLLGAAAVLLGAAVAEELMKPREQRTWEGRILDLIPYDLRIATPEGFRAAKQNPTQARIVLGYRLDLEGAVKFARRRFHL